MAFASYGRLAADLNPPSADPVGYPPTHRVCWMSPSSSGMRTILVATLARR